MYETTGKPTEDNDRGYAPVELEQMWPLIPCFAVLWKVCGNRQTHCFGCTGFHADEIDTDGDDALWKKFVFSADDKRGL